MLLDRKAIAVLKKLNKNGIEAFIVGGAVRDYLLNKKPHDYDICYNAEISEIYRIFKGFNIYETGIKYGTVTLKYKGLLIELTRFRTEDLYLDNRHPKQVNFVDDIAKDLSRRDFTINAMAIDKDKNITDIYGGKQDLKNGIIKAVGNPNERFLEDALRILRAFRFASRFGFEIDAETAKAIFSQKAGLKALAKERITEEIKEILVGEYFEKVFCEFLKASQDIINTENIDKFACLNVLKKVRKELRFLYFVFLFNCENALRLSGKEQRILNILNECKNTQKPDICKLFLNYELDEISIILEYFSLYGALTEEIKNQYSFIIKKGLNRQIKDLKINGNDLKELGFKGAEISKIKTDLQLLILQNKIKNKKLALIKYVKENYK